MDKLLPVKMMALLALMAGAANGGVPSPTGLAALKSFGQMKGSAAKGRVVGMVGFHGQEQPRQWRLLAQDPAGRNWMREYVVQEGKIVADRRFEKRPGQDLPAVPLPTAELKFDSSSAFASANRLAQKVGVGFSSVHYQLRCRDMRNEPVWLLNLIGGQGQRVGAVYISAITGEVLRQSWPQPQPQPQPQPAAAGAAATKPADSKKGLFSRKPKSGAVANYPQPQPRPSAQR